MPSYAYTMGIKNIVQAKMILLIASGKQKSDILYKALCGPVTPSVPASILQLHNHLIIVGDLAALSGLNEKII
jgi:glucosamine-6-phosphate deaminase